MGSKSLHDWYDEASAAFDEIENAHRAVGGEERGRRFVTQQLNYAYVTLLAARFQGFARALHTQTADVIATGSPSIDYELLLQESLTHNRALDRRNAHPDAIAEDFGRFGLDLWVEVEAKDRRNVDRRQQLSAGLGPALVIPSMTMPRASTTPTNALRVGDEVVLRVAGNERRGVVVEDRGALAADGGQIVAIRVGGEDEGRQFEVRAEHLERVVPA